MNLILDTHTLVWLVSGHPQLSRRVIEAMADSETRCFVSAVTAWEYSDLHVRGRLPGSAPFSVAQERLNFATLDFPADLWAEAEQLPYIHGDPIDRMVVAHARALGMTLATVDANMRRYPVATLW